jgi:hypothetical protein
MRARLPWARGLPWAVSVGLHGAILLIGAALVWRVAHEQALPEPDPRNAFLDFDDPSPAHGEGLADIHRTVPSDPGVRTAVGPPPPATDEHPARPGTDPAPPRLRGMSSDGSTAPGPAPGAPALPAAEAPGLRTDQAGALEAPRPAPSGGVKFGGLGASPVRSVAYVVDGSGPMVTTLPVVVDEIKRSVSRLSSSQTFGVIVFRDAPDAARAGQSGDAGFEQFMPVLVRATPGAKERLGKWLAGVQAGGRSNPLDGLRGAIALKPDAVFLLSRSIERSGGGVWQMGKAALMAELDRLNPVDPRNGVRRTVIKTIQFLDEDPTGIMQEIGREHGSLGAGKQDAGYRVVKEGRDLGS